MILSEGGALRIDKGIHSFDLLPESDHQYPSEGRRNGGALGRLATGFIDFIQAWDFPYATDPYFTVDHIAVRVGDLSGYSDEGIPIIYWKIDGGAPILLALLTGASGDLKLWKYLNNSGGTKTLITTISDVFPVAHHYVPLQIKINWSETNTSIVISKDDGSVIYSGSTGVARDFGDGIFHILLGNTGYDSSPSVFKVYVDDAVSLDNRGSVNNDTLGDVQVRCAKWNGLVDVPQYPTGPWESNEPDSGLSPALDERPTDYGDTYIWNLGGDATTDPVTVVFGPEIGASEQQLSAIVLNAVGQGDGTDPTADWIMDSFEDTTHLEEFVDGVWSLERNVYEENPVTSNPWTIGDINSYVFGLVLLDSADVLRISTLYLEYVRPAAIALASPSFVTIVG